MWVNVSRRIEAASCAAAFLPVTAARLESDSRRLTSGRACNCDHHATGSSSSRAASHRWPAARATGPRCSGNTLLPHQPPDSRHRTRWAQTMQRNQPQPPAHLTHALCDSRTIRTSSCRVSWPDAGTRLLGPYNVSVDDDDRRSRCAQSKRSSRWSRDTETVAVEAWPQRSRALLHRDYAAVLRAPESRSDAREISMAVSPTSTRAARSKDCSASMMRCARISRRWRSCRMRNLPPPR